MLIVSEVVLSSNCIHHHLEDLQDFERLKVKTVSASLFDRGAEPVDIASLVWIRPYVQFVRGDLFGILVVCS